ncbi:MAG: TIGR01777 family oxidoreductase [Bacteroidota bacterium]
MKVLITGGTGFIGQHLVQSLTQDEHTVTILSRSNRTSKNRYVSYRQWDGRSMPPAIGLYDVVVNLAGASIADDRWTEDRKRELVKSRIHPTQACVDFINNSPNPPKVFISSSAVGYYGGNREEVVSEDSAPGDDFMAEVCKKWEEVGSTANCRTVLLRTGVVLGNEGGAYPLMSTAYKMFLGGKFGSGKQGFPWIHIQDQIGAIRYCIEKEGIEGPVNLVAPEVVEQKEFSRALARSLGRPDPFIVPKFGLDLIFGERSILFWGGTKVLPAALKKGGYAFSYPALKEALESLVGD